MNGKDQSLGGVGQWLKKEGVEVGLSCERWCALRCVARLALLPVPATCSLSPRKSCGAAEDGAHREWLSAVTWLVPISGISMELCIHHNQIVNYPTTTPI